MAANPRESASASPDLYFVVAGEPSGDLHGSHLLSALTKQEPSARFVGFGGTKMAAAGLTVLEDLPSQAIMGIFPVLAALPKIKSWFRIAEKTLRERRPRALILIDYPGFNLRLATKAKQMGIPVLFYISPQVWAWRQKRVHRIARVVDLLIPILPFEAIYYADTELRCEYVGNPLVDHLSLTAPKPEFVAELRRNSSPIIGVFPGSRAHVVESLAPVMVEALQLLRNRPGLKDLHCIFAAADEKLAAKLRTIGELKDLNHRIVVADPYSVMDAADFCLSTSGTTTLELALKSKPSILAYRVSAPFYFLGKALIRVPHIGLVNLIAGREVVPEHIGVRSFAKALVLDLERLFNDEDFRANMLEGMREVQQKLGGPGAYDRAAKLMLDYLSSNSATFAKDS
ncbi:MAG: lipid-A-disaccharide synthase [Planctomycetota bacterium]